MSALETRALGMIPDGHRAVGPRRAVLRHLFTPAQGARDFPGGEVNDQTANLVVAQLLFLESENPDKDISFYINSPVAVSRLVWRSTTPCSSSSRTCPRCAAALRPAWERFTGGRCQGQEVFLPNSKIMIHQVLGGARGQATDIEIHARDILRTKDQMNRILAERTGQPIEKVKADTERDYFMTADEAMDYGIVDQVISKRP